MQSFRKPSKSFLFGLPFDIFNEGNGGKLPENIRTQRKTPSSPQTRQPIVTGVDPYLSSSGIPLYKYR